MNADKMKCSQIVKLGRQLRTVLAEGLSRLADDLHTEMLDLLDVSQHGARNTLPSIDFEGAEDARIVADRGAGAVDEEERHYPGRSDAALGAV